jgi:hypothetical protein
MEKFFQMEAIHEEQEWATYLKQHRERHAKARKARKEQWQNQPKDSSMVVASKPKG